MTKSPKRAGTSSSYAIFCMAPMTRRRHSWKMNSMSLCSGGKFSTHLLCSRTNLKANKLNLKANKLNNKHSVPGGEHAVLHHSHVTSKQLRMAMVVEDLGHFELVLQVIVFGNLGQNRQEIASLSHAGHLQKGRVWFSQRLQMVVIETINCSTGYGSGELVDLFSNCITTLVYKRS